MGSGFIKSNDSSCNLVAWNAEGRKMRMHFCKLAAVMVLSGMLFGCMGGQAVPGYPTATGGQASAGRQAIVQFRCGACHTIRGIRDANGVFGPPILIFGRGTYIAGEVPNTPDNLVHWIMSPQSIKPKTAMPTLGVSEQQARDIAAYIYTLR